MAKESTILSSAHKKDVVEKKAWGFLKWEGFLLVF